MSAFGIDLGTTNSSISRIVDGRPVALSVDGYPLLPSVVLYRDGGVTVGREARNLELQWPEHTLRSVKRKMGTGHRWTVAGREVGPEEASAEILAALKRGAEAATGETVRDVVITVPAYFDDAQRRATLKAGDLAGLNVLRLLNEPTGASLVYDQVRQTTAQPEIVMVYDLGGGTFDVSVLEVFEGVREVRATAGNTHLGGDDFDTALVRFFADRLKAEAHVDPLGDAHARVRLARVAEATKIRLSAETEVDVAEEFLLADDKGKPVHLRLQVTRRQLEEAIAPLLGSTIDLCRQALAEARLTGGQQLARILLVGGSTRLPMVRRLLREAFPDAPVHEEVDPDLAVALGASVQAGLLRGIALERILVDVTAHSLGMCVLSEADDFREKPDTYAPILHRNTVLPAVRAEEFYTLFDDQPGVTVDVYQGEAPRASQNNHIGSFRFPLQPAPAGCPVRVEFAYDLNGVVRVSIAQSGTDNAKTVALSVADTGVPVSSVDALERRVGALLDRIAGEDKPALEAALAAWRVAQGERRQAAEDALIDLLLFLEDEAEADGIDEEGDGV